MSKSDYTIGAYAVILLLLTALALSSCDQTGKSNINPEWDRNNQELSITIKLYDTQKEMNTALSERLGTPIDPNTLGKAIMSPNDNVCEVFSVRPKRIDDQKTMTLGHEVLHCVYGRYHPE